MANNFKRRYTVKLDIDTIDAEKQIKATVSNLQTIISKLNSSSNKMSYFKELVDYLTQIDAEVDRLKTKHGEGVVNQVFGNLDSRLKKELEGVFGTTKQQLDILDQLRDRLANIKSNPDGADTELKAIESDIKELYKLAGKNNQLDITGKGKFETRIKRAETALNNFGIVFDEINSKVSQGLFIGKEGTNKGLPQRDGKTFTQEAQKQISLLKQQQQNINSMWGQLVKSVKNLNAYNNGDDMSLDIAATEDNARQLIDTLKSLKGVTVKCPKYNCRSLTSLANESFSKIKDGSL